MDSGVRGFNITTPFKERILPFLDELDNLAAASGAVNTVLKKKTNGTDLIQMAKAT